MKKQFAQFIVRWFLNSLGLWVGFWLIGSEYARADTGFTPFLLGGLLLSLANAILRPIVVILSIPAILLTLGLFMLVVNGLMVYLAIALVPALQVSFVGAMIISLVVWLVNYIVSAAGERYNKE